jgi:hypothetical protein
MAGVKPSGARPGSTRLALLKALISDHSRSLAWFLFCWHTSGARDRIGYVAAEALGTDQGQIRHEGRDEPQIATLSITQSSGYRCSDI